MHFHYFLEGQKFTILTDHKSLQFTFTAPLKNASVKQLRQINYISQLTTDIKHTKGCDNPVADCLTRTIYPNQNKLTANSPATIAIENDGDLCDRCSTPDLMPALLDINEVTPPPVNNDAENIETVLIEENVNNSQVQNDVIRK